MPVQIRELNIKITVDGQTTGMGGTQQGNLSSQGNSSVDTEQLLDECIGQVMDILERKKER